MFSESAPTLPGHWLWGNLKDFRRDNLSFIESAARAGDLVRIRFRTDERRLCQSP